MCFRPVPTVEGPIKFKTSDGSGDPVPTYMALGGGGKERTVISDILTSLPDEEISGRKEKSRRRFSRALKAVLFDILLVKKMGSKKYRINSFGSNSNLSTKSEKISKSAREKLLDAEDMLRTNSSRSSSIFSYTTTNGSGSSSCASSIASNSRSVSQRNGSFRTNSMELKQVVQQKHIPIPTKKVSRGVFGSNTGLSLLLLSLLVLIFWGKVCAILCTSTWLFFMPPGQSKGGDLAVNMVGMLDVDSDEYKKRIILEGLLERNRSRQL